MHSPKSPPSEIRTASVIWLHLAIVVVLMLSHVVCAAMWSVASSDTSRDLYFAQQIAGGYSFPLTGPAINGMMHLGPLWYYLLSWVLLLVPNAAAVTGLMGLYSATQFPLAYLLGRRVADPGTGLLFALALALPGWNLTMFGSLTHTVLIVPSILLTTLAAIAYRGAPRLRNALLFGLGGVLLYTAHPTLVTFGVALLVWALHAAPTHRARMRHLFAIVLVMALPLLPLAYDQHVGGYPDLATASNYARSEWSLPSPLAAVELVGASVWYGPLFVSRFWLEAPTGFIQLQQALLATLWFAGVLGLVRVLVARDATNSRLASVLIVALLTHAYFLCAIRDLMPPWMIFANLLLVAALLAIGWRNLGSIRWARRAIATLLCGGVALTFAVQARLSEGRITFLNITPSAGKNGFMDVRDYEDEHTHRFTVPRIAFRDLFDLGTYLCTPTALYGSFSYLVDYTYAVSAIHACGAADRIQLGGWPGRERKGWVGLNRQAWRAVRREPERWIGDLGISAQLTVWHSTGKFATTRPGASNFPRKLVADRREFDVSGWSDGEAVVLVSHRAYRYESFEVMKVVAEGREVDVAYSDEASSIYLVPAGESGQARWKVKVAGTPDYIDVISLGVRSEAQPVESSTRAWTERDRASVL